MDDEVVVKTKKFVLIPMDAMELLSWRFAELDNATESASERCAETGMTMYVVEIRAIASRADRPVTVKKL